MIYILRNTSLPLFKYFKIIIIVSEFQESHLERCGFKSWNMPAQVWSPGGKSWRLCTVLVKKKDGTMRLAVDHRTSNNETKRDSYPLPEVHDILDKLHGSKYYPSVVGA